MAPTQEQQVSDPSLLEYFGLTRPPFAALTEPSQLFPAEQYSLLLEHLSSARKHADSLVVVCGADGSGKSTLLDHFLASLGDHALFSVLNETCKTGEQFYCEFLKQIGFGEISGTVNELHNITREFLLHRANANDNVLIAIDNAHQVNPAVLEQLRRVCEIKAAERRVLSVVLTGSTDLIRVTEAPAMKRTKFRSSVIFGIRNFTEEETTSYVWHCLRLAGPNNGVNLPNEAHALIHRYSGGIPHEINKLCNDLLAEAHRLQSRVITEKIVRTVADKLQLVPHVVPTHGKGRRKTDPDFNPMRSVPVPEPDSGAGKAGTDKPGKTSTPVQTDVDIERSVQQIAQLSKQVEDLRADKTRALQEIDGRNKSISQLRSELDSKTSEIQSLKRFLDINVAKIDQQNQALSQSVASLQKRDDASQKLVTDLEVETRSREAAESELAEARATIDELKRLQQELQDQLEMADGRAAEIEALEDNATALGKALEEKAGELESRNQDFHDLEKQLEESRKEYASAERRIASLKSPEELQELVKKADKLAADLEAEARSREAAESELAEARVTVDEVKQVQQELQAELKIADGRAADLEKQLEESRKEYASAERRIAALKSPEELQEVVKKADQLAADLEAEARSREAAESELAEARATVDELKQLQQELQVQLEIADGRAAEIEALEDNATALEKALEEKAGELESRNQDFVDLEKQLEESRKEYASAERRIAALKSPEELQEVVKKADQLAAELEAEARSREAAESELAEARATVDELKQLQQELQTTANELQVQLETADQREIELEALDQNNASLTEEIARKTEELDSLRGELQAREQTVSDLETWLEESRKEYSSAERRIAALKSPEELQEVVKKADQLAADLEVQTRSREAAESELAESRAIVDELKQLQQELQTTADDLHARLKVADERVVEIDALQKNTADLKDEIESKVGELDSLRDELESRDQAFADLKAQLEDSQNERETLRHDATASDAIDDSVSDANIAASVRDTGIHTSQVVAMFDQSLLRIPAYQTLLSYDQAFYEDLIATYKKLTGLDRTDKQITDILRAKQAKLIERLLPKASDDAILAYARSIVDQLNEFHLNGTEPCFTLLIAQSDPKNHEPPIYSEKTKDSELETLDRTLKTYKADRPLPTEDEVWPDLEPIFDELFEEYGQENVSALQDAYDPGTDRRLTCEISKSLYSEILDLSKRKAVNALRWILSP